jgi:hypothetical protein
MTKPYIVAGLLLVATSAHAADHVWRVYCGNPPTPHQGTFDTAQECQAAAYDLSNENDCVDTKNGPRLRGKRVSSWEENGLHTCAEVRRDNSNCHCAPEAVPEK